MLKAYTIIELAQKEQLSQQGVLYRIKTGNYYIAIRFDSKQYAKNKK